MLLWVVLSIFVSFCLGWAGKGLGREERGIQEPIKGGEVREKGDMFKVMNLFIINSFSLLKRVG